MTRKEQLKSDLLQNFKDFQSITKPGGSDEANEIVAEGLAESIAKAIDNGINVEFKGELSCSSINAAEKNPGYIYTTADSGTLIGATPLEVSANTVVLWDGFKFKTVLRLLPSRYERVIAEFFRTFRVDPILSANSRNPVQNQVVTAALNEERESREAADAALQEQLDSIDDNYETKADAKAKTNAYGIGMRYQNYQTLKFFRPNI